jgi:hypothetical protein
LLCVVGVGLDRVQSRGGLLYAGGLAVELGVEGDVLS